LAKSFGLLRGSPGTRRAFALRFPAAAERGRQVREDIEAQLAQLSPGDTLVLDFSVCGLGVKPA